MVELTDGEGDIDNVNRIFFLKDILPHFGVPSFGLVSVVDAGLEELRHEFDVWYGC